jgi:serine protease AprX
MNRLKRKAEAATLGALLVYSAGTMWLPARDGVQPPDNQSRSQAGSQTYDAGRALEVSIALPSSHVSVAGSVSPNPVAALQRKAGKRASKTDKSKLPEIARSRMTRAVAELALHGGEQPVELIIAYNNVADSPALERARIVALGGTLTRSYEQFPFKAVTIPASALVDLASQEGVRVMDLDVPVTASSQAAREVIKLPVAGSSDFWPVSADAGIAVIDSGISQHSDLSTIVFYDCATDTVAGCVATNDPTGDYDQFGHGTHMAGVIGSTGDLSAGAYAGIAPAASLYSLQALGSDGSGTSSSVLAALDWVMTNAPLYNIRVVNMSLGKPVEESAEMDPLVIAVEQVWQSGIVVVAAAGNYGEFGEFTISSPGNSRHVITVGSLTDNATGGDYSDDYVSTYSSRGPTAYDLVLKPDLLAPGNRVVSTSRLNQELRILLGNTGVSCGVGCDDHYLELSGTSVSTAVVSGTAAIMLSKDPSLTPATVKARLMKSAMKLDGDPIMVGAGLLDVEAALAETSIVTGEALSPKLVLTEAGTEVLLEDPSLLWGSQWDASDLWSNGYFWANSTTDPGYRRPMVISGPMPCRKHQTGSTPTGISGRTATFGLMATSGPTAISGRMATFGSAITC